MFHSIGNIRTEIGQRMVDEQNTEKSTRQKRATQQAWAVQGYLVRYPSRRFAPPADIIELEDKIIVLVEIAGMTPDAFRIALYSQNLVVTGARERPDLPDAAYHQAEIGFGEFKLAIPMPWSVERDSVTASYVNGFLRLELPRQQARRVHIVDVNTETENEVS